jgi:hypothetical protein
LIEPAVGQDLGQSCGAEWDLSGGGKLSAFEEPREHGSEPDHHDEWRWPRPYRTYVELLGRGGELAAVAQAHRRSWRSVVEAVPDGAAALVVGHGGGIEAGLVACLPDADYES